MKTYEYKLYDGFGNLKMQINPLNIISKLSFTEELNWGQWNLNIEIKADETDFVCSDIIEIREVDEDNKTPSPTYTGVIEEMEITEYKTTQVIKISLLGIFTVLNDAEYKQGGLRSFTATWTPWTIVKAIIDSFNLDYWTLTGGDTQNLTTNVIRYTGGSIDITGTSISKVFANVDCLSAIKSVLEDTGFDFYIWADGVCYVTQRVNQPEIVLTFDRQIIKINRKLHKREMVNTYHLSRNGWSEQTYTDAGSVAVFHIKESTESDTSINDLATQNLNWNQKLNDYAYERTEISLEVKVESNSTIAPWKMITTQNTLQQIQQQQITKITKNQTSWTVYMGDFTSFWKTITWG